MSQELNTAQRQVVENLRDNLLVMAPAGTGKTNVTSLRVANLIEHGHQPNEILCLTFTNKACQELQQRLVKVVGKQATKVWVKTFHSFCYELMNVESEALGRGTCRIIDEEDAQFILKELMPDESLLWSNVHQYLQDFKLFQIESKRHKELHNQFQQSEKALRLYERLKNTDKGAYTLAYLGRFGYSIYEAYQAYLERNQLVDFTDLIVSAYELLNKDEILMRWKQAFKVIMVDEVQDTSLVEYQLIAKLARGNQFSAFGDFNQTIYEWRDSNPQQIYALIMEEFQPKRIELTINYRSTQKLVQMGASYLEKAKQQRLIDPKLSPKRIDSATEIIGSQPVFYEGETKEDEMLFIIDHLRHHRLQQLSQTVILTRSNRQNMEVSNFLKAHDIPCYLVDQFAFFKRPVVKDVLALIRYLLSPRDQLALERCLPVYFPHLDVEKMVSPAYKKRFESYQMRLVDLYDPHLSFHSEPFEPLIKSLQQGRLVIFDVESTGLDVTSDEIIQIAAIELIDGQVARSFERFICPKKSVADSVHVHGFDDEYLRKVGEGAQVVLQDFVNFVDGALLVGHNVQYDVFMVTSVMGRLGLEFQTDAVYDTLDIARRLYPQLKNHKLDTVSAFVGVEHEPTHNAMDDILATKDVLVKSLERLQANEVGRKNVFAYYKEALTSVVQEIRQWKTLINTVKPANFLKEVLTKIPEIEDAKDQETLRELIEYLKIITQRELNQRQTLPMWELWHKILAQISLSSSELDRMMKDQNQLAVITVHQAKGLEFEHVIIPFLNQGMFPLDFAGINPEEECRLFYVAMTRAKETLLLTRHMKEYQNSRRMKDRSRFINFLY